MGTKTLPPHPPFPGPPADDPFFYGWRYVTRTDEHGNERNVRVPLTEWDVLHPQEDDYVVVTAEHTNDCNYLESTFRDLLGGRLGTIVFREERIDFQVSDNSVYGPDVVVFKDLNAPFGLARGTFPVKDMEAKPVVAVEVASPNTAKTDRVDKVTEYYQMGIPLYILVDRKSQGGESVVIVYGYRAGREGYERIPDDPRGVWVKYLNVWVRGAGDRVACFDKHGQRILEMTEQRNSAKKQAEEERQRAEQEQQRAEQEQQRAEQERQRAEQERQRAEQERQRAEQERQLREAADQRAAETIRKLAEMEAQLRSLRGDNG